MPSGLPGDGVLVLGIGNELVGDEGVGVLVARLFGAPGDQLDGDRAPQITMSADDVALPAGTEVVDGGTLGIELLDALGAARAAVVIDAVNFREEPGTVKILRDGEVLSRLGGTVTAHQIGLGDLLAVARVTRQVPPSLVLVGVQPESLDWSLDLSPAVAAAVPEIVAEVREAAWAAAGRPLQRQEVA